MVIQSTFEPRAEPSKIEIKPSHAKSENKSCIFHSRKINRRRIEDNIMFNISLLRPVSSPKNWTITAE